MQPRLPTCENTLKWFSEQAILSLEDSFVTRRFLVFRGTIAGPIVDVVITSEEPASVDRSWQRAGLGCDPMRSPTRLGGP
jgi:hypothetical protein